MRLALVPKLLMAAALALGSGLAAAQTVPVEVSVAGNIATARVGSAANPLAELSFTFDDASNLSAESLGISAQLVSLGDPALLARLPDARLTLPNSALPLLVTVAAPAAGNLRFRRTGRFELHTHKLAYTLGSNYRVLKAPIGGNFRDTTEEIAPGSVRARSRYGGFSQFLVVADLRETSTVVGEKIAAMRTRISTLPAGERPGFDAQLDAVETAIAANHLDDALTGIDLISQRALARAGNGLADEWRATRDADNQAGDLLAGAATLKFSVAYLRDYGQ